MARHRSKIRDHVAETRLFQSRAIITFVGILALVGLLLANIYNLQVSQYQDYSTRSNDNRIKIVPISPSRGVIYDRNGVILADNRPVFSLEIIPEQVSDLDQTIADLRKIIHISDDDIDSFKKELRQTRRFQTVPLLNQLTEEEVAKFSVRQYEYPGVSIDATAKRYYPHDESLTHILGYVSRINDKDVEYLKAQNKYANYLGTRDIGKLGVEKSYEDILHGTAGYQEVEINSRGRVIRTLKYVPPVPGKDLVLAIDIKLQNYVYDLLEGRKASVVVLDPKDDSVLALVSSPSYDPNLFVNGISSKAYNQLLSNKDRPLVNRATLGVYPPASTIKPFMAVAALSEGVITPTTTRDDPGYWRIPNSKTKPFRDWLRWGHGVVDVTKSIQESVDTFYYQIAYDMGIDRIHNWMTAFGFGELTGIDINEETRANMPSKDWKMMRHRTPWYKGDTIPVGIGQGYWTATPLQIAKATSVLVNDGKVFIPHLLKATIDKTGKSIEEQEVPPKLSTEMKNVPKHYWDIAKNGMRLVNESRKGTARRAFLNTPYSSAGKSGTAQVFGLGENEKYDAAEIAEHLRDHALYTGFAPYEHPKVVVTVIMENAGGGSTFAAPVARKVFDWVIVGQEKESQQSTEQAQATKNEPVQTSKTKPTDTKANINGVAN